MTHSPFGNTKNNGPSEGSNSSPFPLLTTMGVAATMVDQIIPVLPRLIITNTIEVRYAP